ncbi:MAG: alpha-2-macroglobulin family protein [Pyrinomonadaceae bacterium]
MKQVASFLLIALMYLGSIAPLASVSLGQEMEKSMNERIKDTKTGLRFSLSNGVEGAEQLSVQQPAQTEALSDAETDKLLSRMPDIEKDGADTTDFAKRAGSMPPPKTGDRKPVKFPVDISERLPESPSIGQLQVTRFAPEGDVKLASDLSITFSQPMVAVSSQEEAAQNIPVQLSPKAEGNWRWLGTKTLVFDTKTRFPMATEFTARVPAGTKSATGKELENDVAWKFKTPPPTLVSQYPNGNSPQRRDSVIFLGFDQAINPSEMLESLSISVRGKKIPFRLAKSEEVSEQINYYIKSSEPGRWLAIRAINSDGSTANALPENSIIDITVNKGAPSAEGPLRTVSSQSFTFKTYGAMKLESVNCPGINTTKCSPFESFYIEFTNPVDSIGFDASMINISPAIERANIYPSGKYVYINGAKKGNTKYTITVNPSLKDGFGQNVTGDTVKTIQTGNAPSVFYPSTGVMTVLDPTAKAPSISVYSVNHKSVNMKVYRVAPTDWANYGKYLQQQYYDNGKRVQMPGFLLESKTLTLQTLSDEVVETQIDLSKYLKNGLGNLVLDIEPTTKRDKWDSSRVLTWVQSTKIGLDAFVDNEELIGFATNLTTGAPLAGVQLSIAPNGSSTNPQQGFSGTNETGYVKSLWDWVSSFAQTSEASENASEGKPVMLEPIQQSKTNTTAENGILRLALSPNAPQSPNMLIARKGADEAFLPENSKYPWQDSGTWQIKANVSGERWFVFDDRKMYRPQETVSIKGYVRKVEAGKLGDINKLDRVGVPVFYKIFDSRGNEIGKGKETLNAFGAFDFQFKLPDNANLGNSNVAFYFEENGSPVYYHSFQVQEFRRPEFEVSTKIVTEAPHFVGESTNVEVEAKYYAGGALANADVNWNVTSTPTNFTPPNQSDYIFGTWIPWWYHGQNYDSNQETKTFKGVTDASGKHNLKIDFETVNPPRPYSVSASSSVQDVNRQTWASSTSMIVHPASLYVGLKPARNFVQKGEEIGIDTIVSDLNGNLVAGKKVEISAELKDWRFEKGKWVEKSIDKQFCDITSATEAKACKFMAKDGGKYTLKALVMDDRERFNQTELTIWVAGGKTVPNREVSKEEVQIIPDKKNYAPGDVAELLVIAPFSGAEGVLTLRREGIVKTERFTIKGSSATLKIPIEAEYLPNIHAQVDLTGAAIRTDDEGNLREKLTKRPAYASGEINLEVTKDSRRLTVKAEPLSKTVEPGGNTDIKISVTDNDGKPAGNTEVAVVVVDESVLALSGYDIQDPVSVFYQERQAGVRDYYSRADVILGNPENIATLAAAPAPAPPSAVSGGRDRAEKRVSISGVFESESSFSADSVAEMAVSASDTESNSPISLRKNFDALAVFAPHVKTDSSGRASVPIKVPDNLTRYRIMAVSVDAAKRFGKGESSVTARQPLMVRPSAPRFMNFGDKIELPVVVQNQTDSDMYVNVGVRATNAVLTNGDGQKVLVKANNREEVRFPVSAEKAGTARFQFAASSGKYSDAAEISLPVWTPATTEAFATYGTTDKNGAIVQPVRAPNDVFPQFGGLEVTTSSTQLQELTDAFIYLYRYRFDCTEQVSSRMISIAALQDVLTAFKAKEMPSNNELKASFAKDMEILQSRQNDNGNFGLWRKNGERYEYPFVTAHTAHALILAKSKGYDVPKEMLTRVAPYLKNIEQHMDTNLYSPEVRWTISAYALYVRNLMGDRDEAKAKRLLNEATIQKMPFEALGWLLNMFADSGTSQKEVTEITRFLLNNASETASTAQFNTDYGDGNWLIMASNRRADGVILEALLKVNRKQGMLNSEPKEAEEAGGPAAEAFNTEQNLIGEQDVSDLIPKIVRGLLEHRKKGRWDNTQENVFILLALDSYFQAYESVTPNFVTQIWLGDAYAGEQKFAGRSSNSNVLEIPMQYLMSQGGSSDLILNKQGAGRLYYRLGMNYAPKNLNLKPADYGFTVLRSYEAVDKPEDVTQTGEGHWKIKAGARVRVKLTMVADARRYHVALVDPLPAGLEILNPDLAVTEAIPNAPVENTGVRSISSRSYGGDYYFWRSQWFEHQNFRDERAEAFSSLVWGGVYEYSYVARATTPGEFVVPPAKAEEMYHPETFGRTGTDFVSVK